MIRCGLQSWQTAANLMVSTAAGSSTAADVLQQKITENGASVRFQCVVDVSRVNNATNWSAMGVDAGTWEGIQTGGSTGVVLHMVDLDSAPTYDVNGALSAFSYTPSGTSEGSFVTDPSGVFTIATEPCSVSPWVSIGNLVWNDVNSNGLRDGSELGISGATVQLFSPGADNAVGGTGADADTQVGASVLSSSAGVYAFTNLVPGKYYVRVTPTISVPGVSSVVSLADDDIDNDNNGSQPGGPGTFVYSPVVDVEVGGEAGTGVDGDGTNGNSTVDFGLFTGITVGDLVWNDANNNGVKDTGESGVSGVQVDLYSPGADNAVGGTGLNADTLLQSTSTLSSGIYSFKVYTGGSYFVRLTPPAAYSLASSTVVTTDNGVNNDSNGAQPGGAGSAIYSMVFQLSAGGEPGSSGSSNNENTLDFGLHSCPAITLTPASLTNAQKGAAYSATFNAAGGNSPYTWSLASGALPGGLTLSSAGVLNGTVTAAPATYNFTVKVVDTAKCAATQAMTLSVVCPVQTLAPTSLAGVAQSTAFSQQFTTSGGTAGYTYTKASGTMPAGATLTSSGLLAGTITGAPGSYTFVIRSTDANGCALDTAFTWVVTCPTITLAPTSVPAATQYAAYTPQTLTASNGVGPYNWSFTGTMPTGMTLSSTGVLSGTPTSAPGTYNITVTATDANSCARSGSYAITVNCPAFTIAAPTLPNATKNVAYGNVQLSASGGTAPYSWSLSGGALPAGLSMSSAGLISGTPTAAPATFNFTVQATDGVSCAATKALQIVIACPTLAMGPVPLAAGVQYAAYTQTLSVGGGTGPYGWSVASGVLPTGLTLSSDGILSGTPTTLGSSTFVLRATDADHCASTQQFTFTVNYPPIYITPTTLTNATRLVPYFVQLSATGGTAPYSFSKLTGALPTGLTISSTGVISGSTSAAPGDYSFTVQALDANGAPGTQPYTIAILCPTLNITPATLANGVVGTAYTASLNATGGSAPYNWTITSGTLPAGLSMSTSGLISGTPTQATTASFTVQAVDAYNCLNTQVYTLAVNCPAITLTPTTLANAYYNIAYSQQLTANGGTGPYSWSVIAGSPPAGMTVSTSGLIAGAAQVYGTANFTVRGTDANNCTATQSYALLVKGLSVGDTVFEDSNFNGLRDVGEPGISGITVELWDPGADDAIGGSGPNSDLMLSSMSTDAQGRYTFINLQPGTFFMRVLMPSAQNIIGGNPVNLDNGVDNDNNAATQPGGPGTAVFSPVITLTTGGEPTVDDGDADTENTLDFGLFRGMNVGNLVWQDTNDNGLREAGEPGIDGVTVELWDTGADGSIGGTDDALLRSTTTSDGGAYLFASVPPLKVYVRIPTPPGAQPLSSSNTNFLDNGVDNDDNGLQLSGGAVNSPVITLTAADEPGTGGGTYEETTIDFGFINMTPNIYVSATQADSIQTFDAETGLYTGPLVAAFGNSLSQGNADYGDVPYGMELGPDGNWYVAHYGGSNLRKISPTGTDLGLALDNSSASMSLVTQFAIGPDGNFYVFDVNGGRVVRFQGPSGAMPGKPIGSAPFTFITQDGVEDMNFGPDGNLYLVVQTDNIREVRRYSTTTGELLNTIVTDTQLVGMVPGGGSIALVSGIDIEGSLLYGMNRSDGEVFSIDLSTPAAPGLPQLVATLASAGKGEVDTRDIEFNPANNRLYINGYSWAKPVNAGSYNSGALISVDIASAPNGTVHIYEVPIPRPPGPNFEIWSGPRDLAIGRPFAPLPDSVAIGSIVWNDDNADGIQDAAELGIPGVRVELWQDVNGDAGDGAEFFVGWTYTDGNGFYYFSGEAPGVYQVQIPESNFVEGLPLAGSGYSSPISSIQDDQIDGDDSGRQPGGPKTLVTSPLITLTPGTEPTGNGSSGVEFARGGELDDFIPDANGDMTIDFGFVEPGIMGIGNLVFVDDNGNNRFDVGEGRDDITIELYRWGDTPGVTQPVATAVTADGGLYLFSNLWQGQYFIYLPAYQFEASGNLRGLYSLPVITAGDDNTGQDALPTDTPWITGVRTGIVNLVRDQAPTDTSSETGFDSSTDLNDINIDLTVDIGLFRPVSLGNMVFADNNSNGHYDAGEGSSGISVELYTDTQFPEVDNPLAITTTDAVGRYGFNFLRPGNYVVHIPSSMFQVGAPLYQRISIAEGLVGDDDVGEDGINDGAPTDNGVSSLVISLYPGNAPTDDSGETGFEGTSDNEDDAAIDLTIDFGFQMPVGVGNLVYIDTNQNGFADVGEGVDGVTVELYRSDQTPGSGVPLFSRITSGGGEYFFDSLPAGNYVVHIPYSQFEPGHALEGLASVTGVSSISAVLDDNVPNHENGIDDATPFLNGISSAVFTLAVDAEPTDDTGETGEFNDIDAFDDNNFDLTIDFAFAPSNPNGVGVGNLVFVDLDGNGRFDVGEGIDGVKVQLFDGAADVRTSTPLSTLLTSNGGTYLFSNLVEGDYQLFIPPSEFAAGKPLSGWRSLPGDGGDTGVDDSQDENGIDVEDPTATGIASVPFHLSPGDEPTDALGEFGYDAFMDNVNDANSDLTIDFGFFRSVAVGNLVFIDANYNGRADAGEGVGGVSLQLYAEDALIPFDEPVASTTSDSDGSYLFADINPGRYFIRIPQWQFTFGSPLYAMASIMGTQTGDDNVGEDGVDEGNPNVNGVQTAVFELVAAAAPTGSQESGFQGSSDDIDDAGTDLTIDLGFVLGAGIGNVVFSDTNNDGHFDPELEIGVDGVTVELWSNEASATAPISSTTTAGGGLYSFSVAPGTYYVNIPASNFAADGALVNQVASKPVDSGTETPTSTSGDDDVEQDGYTPTAVTVDGARTALFTLVPNQAPTFDTTETGYYSETDDFDDTNTDLTIDLGFAPKPLSVGNLIFRDLNSNGSYDGQDFGVAGVKVRLFKVGDDPASATPVMETTTSIDGTYLLNTYEAGDYFVYIPATEFTTGGALAGTTSTTGFGSDNGVDDDADENGLDTGTPATNGVSSTVFNLDYGTEPLATTGESGFLTAMDQYNDADVDLSIDLGFTGGALPDLMSIGNLVFNDANNNGVADSGEGVPGVWMLLYSGTGTAGSTSYIRSTTTDASGRYFFTNLSPGTYTVHVAADNFKEAISINGGAVGNGPLFHKISLRGNQVSTADDDVGEDGIDAQNPEQVGITAHAVTLTANAAPSGAAESGFQGSSDDANDSNVDLTIDFGFATRLGVGNLVFRDNNADGKYQTGTDTGIAGIRLELVYNNGIGGADSVVGSTTTNGSGEYILYGPPASAPQTYWVRIPADQFSAAGALNYLVPSVLAANGSDDNLNQNAQPAASPEITGAVTAPFSLQAGTLPTDSDGRESGFDMTSDNADDANNDLSLDLGLKPKSIMVGNLIFRDANGNGTFESGIDQAMANVTVNLFQQAQVVTDTPVSTAVTAADGTYLLYASAAAAYYVHVPAAMFASGAPLDGMSSVLGSGDVDPTTNAETNKDDRFDENGADATQPSTTGVSSGIINLAYGTMPLNSSSTATTGENGDQAFMDDAADASGIMTIDFGFVSGSGAPDALVETRNLALNPGTVSGPATTFTGWQTQNSLNGLNQPNDDPDADGQSNLLEYALGTAAGNGLGTARFKLVQNATTGAIDAQLIRPSGTHADLHYYLEGSTDLSVWSTLVLTPVTTANADQTETLRYGGVESAFSGAARGFLRLKITLDANLDGTPEATATTGVQGWARRLFPVGRQSLAMPLVQAAIYTGQVSTNTDRSVVLTMNGGDLRTQMQNGVSYYLEVLDGALRGRTFDVDTPTTDSSITLTTAPEAALASARICIRPHWTLGALVPVSGLQPGTTADAADRLMFFDSATGQFQLDWLQTTSRGGAQWVRDGDASLSDDAARLVPPQTGLLVQIRSTATTLTFLGEVRSSALALPPTAGTSLRGTGLATAQTPGALPFTPGAQLRVWSGDTDPTTSAYQNYQLNAQGQWMDEATGLEVTTQPLLDAFRAFFLVKP